MTLLNNVGTFSENVTGKLENLIYAKKEGYYKNG